MLTEGAPATGSEPQPLPGPNGVAENSPFQRRVNWELIEKTLVNIEGSPDNFNMKAWASVRGKYANVAEQQRAEIPLCGTTMCFAGWAVYTAGHKINWSVLSDTCIAPEGPHQTIKYAATTLLGLSNEEARKLFASNSFADCLGLPPVNNVNDLRARITKVLGEPQ